MYRILIVEDDLTIASALAAHLRKWDYEADYVEDFKNVMERFGAVDPQLVILDIGLPFFNGFYWCSRFVRFHRCGYSFCLLWMINHEYRYGNEYGRG